MSVDAFLASAAVTGCLGAGGLLMVHAAWRLRRPTFAQRVAAGRVAAPSSRAARDSGWMLRALESIGSTTSSVERRLILLGAETDMAAFRLHQVATGIGLTAIALLIGAPLAVGRGVQGVFVLLLISIIGFIGGLGAWDRLLTHRSRTRQRRIDMEVPDMSELLALAVGAGESIPAALERVAQISSTDLNGEVAKTVSEIRLGASPTWRIAMTLRHSTDSVRPSSLRSRGAPPSPGCSTIKRAISARRRANASWRRAARERSPCSCPSFSSSCPSRCSSPSIPASWPSISPRNRGCPMPTSITSPH